MRWSGPIDFFKCTNSVHQMISSPQKINEKPWKRKRKIAPLKATELAFSKRQSTS